MKLLFKIFLSLGFLLLHSYGGVSASAYRDSGTHAPVRTFGKSQVAIAIHEEGTLPDTYTQAYPENEYDKIFLEEVEDERDEVNELRRLISSSKDSELSNYFSAFYAQSTGYFCYHAKRRLHTCERFSYTVSCKYILFRVFRV